MPPRPATMRNRWAAYAALSTGLAAAVVLKSMAQRPNLYSAMVYLYQSSANMMILCNLVFVAACTFLFLLQRALYGPLRTIETEQLYEKAWFAVTETCLAMTIFRSEIGPWFLVMFFSLLAGKIWGWIGEGRVEVMEQQQHNILSGASARVFHIRMLLSLAVSVAFDLAMLDYTVGQVLHMARPDMMVMFGFEFAVLTISSLSTAMRYALHLVEANIVSGQKKKRIEAIRKERIDAAVREVQPPSDPAQAATAQETEPDLAQRRRDAETTAAAQPIDEADVEVEGWEGKGRWTFYLDLTTDFFKLCIYLSFFFILLIFYGLPLHIIRDVFLTCRSFFKRIGDFVRYRNATRDMNERYPDATEAEIGREDVCIICREEMRPYVPPAPGTAPDPVVERMRPKKLPCGHVLHFSCLRSWLERQQICPTCRATVVPTTQAQQPPTRAPAGNARPQHQPAAANGRPRVYQLGPLRIGVGAVRGNDLLDQLDQQLANVNPPPPEVPNENAPQQYGFGIRWGTPRRRPRQTRTQDILNAAERRLQQEADALQASMSELQELRDIQAQLARIRMARDGTAPAGQQAPSINRSVQAPLTATMFRQNAQQNILQAGSDQLPTGLTLPEGWSMMPLEPVRPNPLPGQFTAAIPFQTQVGGFAPFPAMQPVPAPAVFQPGQATPQPPLVERSAEEPQAQSSPSSSAQTAGDGAHAPPTPSRMQTNPTATTAATTLPPVAQMLAPLPLQRAPPPPSIQQSRQSNTSSSQSSVSSANAGTAPSRSVQTPPAPITSRQPLTRTTEQARTSTVPSLAAANPPQRFAANVARSTNGGRTPSPHRVQKSIGSSWGFSGVESADERDKKQKQKQKQKDEEEDEDDDDDDDDDDDEDDEDEQDEGVESDEEDDEPTAKVKGKYIPGRTNGHASASSQARAGSFKSQVRPSVKSATVEDDDDDEPD